MYQKLSAQHTSSIRYYFELTLKIELPKKIPLFKIGDICTKKKKKSDICMSSEVGNLAEHHLLPSVRGLAKLESPF